MQSAIGTAQLPTLSTFARVEARSLRNWAIYSISVPVQLSDFVFWVAILLCLRRDNWHILHLGSNALISFLPGHRIIYNELLTWWLGPDCRHSLASLAFIAFMYVSGLLYLSKEFLSVILVVALVSYYRKIQAIRIGFFCFWSFSDLSRHFSAYPLAFRAFFIIVSPFNFWVKNSSKNLKISLEHYYA